MSTFSAPSKPDAFQPIKAESVERPRCWKVCRTIEKNRSYYGLGNSMESIRYYDMVLNLEQPLFVYEFKINTWPP